MKNYQPAVRFFSGNRPANTHFIWIFWILPELFPVFKISTGNFLKFSTFAPTFFSFFNFRPEIFYDFQISNRKKIPKTQIPGDPLMAGLRRGHESVVYLFFQLSTGNFLQFSTFNPKFFRIFKFQTENFSARELSVRKILRSKHFSASEPGPIGRTGFCRGPCAPSAMWVKPGVFPDFAAIVRNILGRTNFRAKKIREMGKTGRLAVIAGTNVHYFTERNCVNPENGNI